MNDEKKKLNEVELNDEELGRIQGGFRYYETLGGTWYRYDGGDSNLDSKYLCPKCRRPVHRGKAWRYYCDSCGESWFLEDYLKPNLGSGLWTRVSKEDVPTFDFFNTI